MNGRIAHSDAVGVLNSLKSVTKAARNVGEDEVCEIPIGPCEPEITTARRVLGSCQVIAETCSDSEKYIRHDVVVKFVRNGDLGYKKKGVRPGCLDLLTQQDAGVNHPDKDSKPLAHRQSQEQGGCHKWSLSELQIAATAKTASLSICKSECISFFARTSQRFFSVSPFCIRVNIHK